MPVGASIAIADELPQELDENYLIIDDKVVVTGSYNFSKSARTRNDENTLITQDPGIAARYLEEFERVWGLSEN